MKRTWRSARFTSPAGFQYGALASSATATKASPIPRALAPTPILRNSPAYLSPRHGEAIVRNRTAGKKSLTKGLYLNSHLSWGPLPTI
jgi:hypothetical protein